MTVLAVATWVIPFALLTVLIAVPGDDWSPVSVALLAGGVLVLGAAVVCSGRLERRLSPAHGRRYHRVSRRTMSVCTLLFFLGVTAKAVAHADWFGVLAYGFCSVCYLSILSSELRRARGGAPPSPGSA